MRNLLILLCLLSFNLKAEVIGLQEIIHYAVANDAKLQALKESTRSLQHRAIAAGSYPDPKFKIGVQALPVDTFSRTQEPMTQLQFGVQQQIPKGDTLEYRASRLEAEALAVQADIALRELMIARDVRKQYVNWAMLNESLSLLRENLRLFAQLADVTQSQYASGTGNQQDVLNAEVNISLIKDRIFTVESDVENARISLQRWMPDVRGVNFKKQLPELRAPDGFTQNQDYLLKHPLIRQADAKIEGQSSAISIAEEQYKPGFTIDTTYGARAGHNPDMSDRADFMSVMLMIDLPLFAANREDRELSAAKYDYAAAKYNRSDLLRVLQEGLRQAYSEWRYLGKRLSEYKNIRKHAQSNAQAALDTYQSGLKDFDAVINASILELETSLSELKIKAQYLQKHADILYYEGAR